MGDIKAEGIEESHGWFPVDLDLELFLTLFLCSSQKIKKNARH